MSEAMNSPSTVYFRSLKKSLIVQVALIYTKSTLTYINGGIIALNIRVNPLTSVSEVQKLTYL